MSIIHQLYEQAEQEYPKEVIAYHGTRSKFKTFDIGKAGSGNGRFANGIGFYFTTNPDSVKAYIRNPYTYEYDGRIIKAKLMIRNPLVLNTHALDQGASRAEAEAFTKKLLADGYDSVVIDHVGTVEYVVFSPDQIKVLDQKIMKESDTQVNFSFYDDVQDSYNTPEEDDDEGAAIKFMEYYDKAMEDTLRDLRDKRPPKWQVAPFGVINKLWNDFANLGIVRDERTVNQMVDLIVNNIAKIRVYTELSGHTTLSPEELAEEKGFEWTEDMSDYFDTYTADKNGMWRISDSILNPLTDDAIRLLQATRAEDKVVGMDRVFNRVHPRSDVSAWFIQGGRNSLNKLFGSPSQEYTKNPLTNKYKRQLPEP